MKKDTAVGLTPDFREGLPVIFVKESSVNIACRMQEKIDVHLNGTTIIIGRMIQLELPENCKLSGGSIDLGMPQNIACSGLDTYHVTKVGKLRLAKK